jgi:hypothetical protein
MVREDKIRAAERAVEWPDATDAGLNPNYVRRKFGSS